MELGISQEDLVSLLKNLLTGKDLSIMTPKVVRQMVIKELGEKVGDDPKALKIAIRSALNVVLSDHADEIEQKPDTEMPAKAHTPDTTVAGNNDSCPEKEEEADEVKPKEMASDAKPKGKVDDVSAENTVDIKRKRRQRSQKPAKKVEDSDMSDDDDADDEKEDADDDSYHGGEESEEDKPKRRASIKPSRPAPKKANLEEQDKPKRKVSGVAIKSASMRTEKYLGKLRSLAKQLGIPVPPSRYRGTTTEEKSSNILAFFVSKGFKMEDPTRMTRDEIAGHRKRLEQEKELDGLDVRYVQCIQNHPIPLTSF